MARQCDINRSHVCIDAKVGQTGDPKFADPTRDDARKMGEVGRDVNRQAMQTDPSAHAHTDRANLCLPPVRPIAPDANPSLRPARSNAKIAQRIDDPCFDGMDETAHVAPAIGKV